MTYTRLILCKLLKKKECVVFVECLAPPNPKTWEYLIIGTKQSIDLDLY